MSRILITLFLVLWFSNYWMASYFYPDYKTDIDAWYNFSNYRKNIYEIMMLILLLTYFFKKDRIVKALFASSIVLVSCNIIDKVFQGILTYAYSDIIVIGFAIALGIYTYKNER